MPARDQRQRRRDERQAEREARARAGRDRPALRRWRIWRRAAGDFLLRTIGPWALRALAATWRVQRRGEAGLAMLREGVTCVYVLWHGRMLVPLPLPLHRGRGIGVLVSPSDDGKLASLALRHFGFRVIRGSASRQGSRSLREMAEALDGGQSVVITPDGPRGPRHTMNSGPAWLARATGVPLVTAAIAVDRAWRLRSWDRFTIPKPFARIVVTYGDPVTVAAGVDDEALERIAREAGERLLDDERDGFAALGVDCDHGETAVIRAAWRRTGPDL